MIDDYSLLKTIGKGAFGEVYLTSKEGSNRLFATKKVSKKKVNSPTLKKYFFNEISILKEINHKNIIHFETIKHTVHNFYIITEYCNGGGLSDCLLKYKKLYGKPFSEQIVQHIMRQIVEALNSHSEAINNIVEGIEKVTVETEKPRRPIGFHTQASIEPETCSAKTLAASLAEGIKRTLSNCSIVNSSPSCKLALE